MDPHAAGHGEENMMSDLSVVEFSRYPAGRTDNDGPFSGARYRREVLVPALIKARQQKGERVRLLLDGARTYGSSFLEEAFGGLVREEGFSAPELHTLLDIVVEDPGYELYRRLILKFINEAVAGAH